MNEDSLKKTLPKAEVLGKGILRGYRRIFNVKSPYRKNQVTGLYSSVLNIEPEPNSFVCGTVIDLSNEKNIEGLFKREEGYNFFEVVLEDQTRAFTCMAKVQSPHPYVLNDSVQKEYLDICIAAAKKFGFLEDFLRTTFVGDKPISELDFA